MNDLQVIGIVRNPCAVINSWFQAHREFKKEWDPLTEWRFAPSKNQGKIEEFNGFEKWKEVALMFLNLQKKYQERFLLIQYEQLVEDPIAVMENAFSFVGLKMENQVKNFINASQSLHLGDAYALYKSPSVKNRWRLQLDTRIYREIVEEIKGKNLERFSGINVFSLLLPIFFCEIYQPCLVNIQVKDEISSYATLFFSVSWLF